MDLLADLNEPQRNAVLHTEGPLLVLAGAGSGKTRVITRRVAHLIRQGVPSWKVLAITFTNKAAGEMKERILALDTPPGATVATFHALCARLLREYAPQANLTRNFSIYDRSDQLKIVKQAMEKLDMPTDKMPPGRVHATISNAKNELITDQAFASKAGDFYTTRVAQIYTQYERLLSANNALDFDDLLLRMAYLLRDNAAVRAELSRRYQYVLIDEYQDTNHAQYLLAKAIATDHQNICATGDPDQSIYAWRGADISNILEFEEDFPGATVIRLEENYRSTKPILAVASNLIAHNTQRKEKSLWTRREGGTNVQVISLENEHAEADEVARRIVAYRDAGGQYSDVAVFYRVNSLSRLVEEGLLKKGIPYAIARGVEFYNRKEIKDVLAYLRLLANPADDLSCERVINTPLRGIGATTINRLIDFAASQNLSLLDACRVATQSGLSGAAAKKVQAFGDMIAAIRSNLSGSVRDIVEDVFKRSGLEESLGGNDEDDRQARSNVYELINVAAEFDQSGGTLEEYLHQISLVSDADHFEGSGGSVMLMTFHAAKGLEFPVVFIIGFEQGLLPFVREETGGWNNGGAAKHDLEEERRLAFVGITRSMSELTITCARRRMIRGQTLPQAPSQFLEEMGSEGVSFEEKADSFQQRRFTPRSGQRGGFYADVAQREAIESLSWDKPAAISGEEIAGDDEFPMPSEYEHLRVGSSVHHPMFGNGKVMSISQPWPQTRVTVAFAQAGIKKLVLAQSKLEMI